MRLTLSPTHPTFPLCLKCYSMDFWHAVTHRLSSGDRYFISSRGVVDPALIACLSRFAPHSLPVRGAQQAQDCTARLSTDGSLLTCQVKKFDKIFCCHSAIRYALLSFLPTLVYKSSTVYDCTAHNQLFPVADQEGYFHGESTDEWLCRWVHTFFNLPAQPCMHVISRRRLLYCAHTCAPARYTLYCVFSAVHTVCTYATTHPPPVEQ